MTDFSRSYVLTDTILETYIGADPRTEAIALKAAATASQAWYCQQATAAIDRIPLDGKRYEAEHYENGVQTDENDDGLTQVLEFPRIIDNVTCDYDWETDLPIVPQRVIDACCEEAIALYAHYSGSSSKRAALRADGVTSYSIGDLSESLGGVSISGSNYGLRSQAAADLLKRYMLRSCSVL